MCLEMFLYPFCMMGWTHQGLNVYSRCCTLCQILSGKLNDTLAVHVCWEGWGGSVCVRRRGERKGEEGVCVSGWVVSQYHCAWPDVSHVWQLYYCINNNNHLSLLSWYSYSVCTNNVHAYSCCTCSCLIPWRFSTSWNYASHPIEKMSM